MVEFKAPYYPIVFIRGFAMSDSDIREAANQVYQGFEAGSTRAREAGGEYQRRPIFFQSPVMRLIKDHGYEDSFNDNLYGFESPRPLGAKSLWVHRYYDEVDTTFGGGKRLPMFEYALGLRRTILKIRDKLCGDSAEARAAFKVHLVAHSMGGLVARTYLQRICRPSEADRKKFKPGDELKVGKNESYVSRFFTYATPHNGIEVGGMNVPSFGNFDPLQTGFFNRSAMRDYFASKAKEANDLDGAFSPDDTFCLIGTAYRDYNIDVSKWATGGPGDGLVLCRNAYTRGSPRAFVRRAHGGPYGIVNCEEGYQNLRRFLFGDWRIDVEVVLDDIRPPDDIVAELKKPGDTIEGSYLMDVVGGVRGAIAPLQERLVLTESAVTFFHKFQRDKPNSVKVVDDKDNRSVVASLFLRADLSAETKKDVDGPMVFTLQLGLEAPRFQKKGGGFFDDKTLPDFKVLLDTVLFRIDPANVAKLVTYGYASRDGQTFPETLAITDNAIGFTGELPIGPPVGDTLKSGAARGRIILTATKR